MSEIEEGRYVAKIQSHTVVTGKKGDGVRVTFQALGEIKDDREIRDLPAPVELAKAFWMTSDGAVRYSTRQLRGCGWTGSDYSELMPGGGDKLDGMVTLVIEEDEYMGQTRMDIKFVNQYSPRSAPEADRDAVRARAAKMAQRIKDEQEALQIASDAARRARGGAVEPDSDEDDGEYESESAF